jgi:hypothetical protein
MKDGALRFTREERQNKKGAVEEGTRMIRAPSLSLSLSWKVPFQLHISSTSLTFVNCSCRWRVPRSYKYSETTLNSDRFHSKEKKAQAVVKKVAEGDDVVASQEMNKKREAGRKKQ